MLRWLENLYSAVHHRVYQSRLSRQRRFKKHYIVSIGNLSAGGTGKTPVAAFLAGCARKYKPLICLRGYGGDSGQGVLVADGGSVYETSDRAGDEAVLLGRITQASVAAGKNRVELIEKFGNGHAVILLDDAFQNPAVYRDHELVLLDSTVNLDHMRLIPTGRFRDRLDALTRADTVLFTRVDQARADSYGILRQAVLQYVPAEKVFESIHEAVGFRPALPEGLKSIGAFCGIGNPDSFFQSVEKFIKVDARYAFPDHHQFSAREIRSLLRQHPDMRWAVTEKDEVRLQMMPEIDSFIGRLHFLEVRLKVLGGRELEFVRRVLGKFGEVSPSFD